MGNKWFWIEQSKFKALLFDIYERGICRQHFDAYHVVSDSTKRDYERFCGKNKRVVRIYNSVQITPIESVSQNRISARDYFGLGDDCIIFLYFGRPAPNKGVFILEEAIAKLHKERKIPEKVKFCWLLARDPALQRQMLLNKMGEDEIWDKVVIRESVKREEMFKIISGADYVIIPSITEGFGFCAVEACAMGKCVIYSSGGSLPEVVFGRCLMFRNRDAADLATKIHMAINEGSRAFDVISEKNFGKDRTVGKIIQLYERILSEDAGGRKV